MKSRRIHGRLEIDGPRKRSRTRRALNLILGLLLLGIGAYALAGFFGGPWLIDRWLTQFESSAPGRAASLETVRFNPFSLIAEFRGLETRDEQAGAAFAADWLIVNLSVRSLTERRPVIRSIIVGQPRIELASIADLTAVGRLVLSAASARTRIDHFELLNGTVTTDFGIGEPTEIQRFDFAISGFDQGSGAGARYSLDAVTAARSAMTSNGSLSANLERADGQIRLEAIELASVAAGLGGIIGDVRPQGRMDLAAGFDASSLLDAPAVRLTDATLGLSDLSLSPAAGLTVTTDRAAAAATLTLAATETGIDVSGRVQIDGTQLSVRDSRVAPPPTFALDDAIVLATADPDNEGLSLSLVGRLRGAGEAALSVRVPLAPTAGPRVSIEAVNVPAATLSAYTFESLGRPATEGTADVNLEYSLDRNRVNGSLHIVARELAFASAPGSAVPDIGRPSLELATALLENRDRVIELDLSFASNVGTVRNAANAALGARLATVTETPLAALAPLMNGDAANAYAVPFLPGDAALNDNALASIGQFTDALDARPRLGMRVHGGYDPASDRDALARQQIELHVQLATAGPGAQARPAPVDFDSARARDVLDEFAGERLPAERVAALAERFDCEGAFIEVCQRSYYELIFDALVANEEIAPTALTRLGRFRALSVADALRQRGIADDRIEIDTGADVVETPFGVGLPVEFMAAGIDNASGP